MPIPAVGKEACSIRPGALITAVDLTHSNTSQALTGELVQIGKPVPFALRRSKSAGGAGIGLYGLTAPTAPVPAHLTGAHNKKKMPIWYGNTLHSVSADGTDPSPRAHKRALRRSQLFT